PVTLLYRRDTPLDGSAPCLLYGYGSYGITIPAGFNTNCLSLADRGFVYAIEQGDRHLIAIPCRRKDTADDVVVGI
ncbi:hypothetical protein ACC702_40255, partial [Rhizobium ruizarguesonis]